MTRQEKIDFINDYLTPPMLLADPAGGPPSPLCIWFSSAVDAKGREKQHGWARFRNYKIRNRYVGLRWSLCLGYRRRFSIPRNISNEKLEKVFQIVSELVSIEQNDISFEY